ncbi:MAG: hypothetical protein JSS10_03075 [Verrucomicrobia bacterium]|nr:hypothetical protein [Verrucomicrobiota bacterium]
MDWNLRATFFHLFIGICWISNSIEALNKQIFYEKLQQSTPKWMVEQIQHDLAPFQKELSQKFLDEIFAQKGLILVRVKVANGKLTIQKSVDADKHSVPDEIIPHIEGLHHIMSLPDIDFIFTGHDTLSCDLSWPIFVITKCNSSKGLILFPDWYALRGFEPFKSFVLKGNSLYPWETKKNILFFRGADSGVNPDDWKNSPRPRFVALSLQYPNLIDAKFALDLHHKHMFEIAKREGFIGDYVSMEEHPKYKYLMDIDGNCAATPRFPLLLYSNSVILKNMTNSMLWFYPAIKPYIHFIPVAEDLSDVLVQLNWAKNHDVECRIISENASQVASEVLSQEAVYLYFYRLLEEYSKRQREQYNLE